MIYDHKSSGVGFSIKSEVRNISVAAVDSSSYKADEVTFKLISFNLDSFLFCAATFHQQYDVLQEWQNMALIP